MADPTKDFTAFQDTIFQTLLSSVKTSSSVASKDVSFLRTANPSIGVSLDRVNARILGLADSLLKSAVKGSDHVAPRLLAGTGAGGAGGDGDGEGLENVENSWGAVVEVVDYLLEKADTSLDEFTGAIKRREPEPSGAAEKYTTRLTVRPQRQRNNNNNNIGKTYNISKPQLSFKTPTNNTLKTPFKPILTKKPHALLPLSSSIILGTTSEEEGGGGRGGGRPIYKHPYETEIQQMTYPARMFTRAEPTLYKPFEGTDATWVDTPEALQEMLGELRGAGEIAVDLEHHDMHSFVGIVCLMQVSNRERDWIVDTLKLREELEVLNEVFADPGIVKVLHGAYMDVKWLQRDFGLYLVGLFDTHFASKALGFPGLGLAYLLKRYIDFDADKQYQLADWRIRPLPKEMFDYARSDTHFLLYIFDNLRNELLERSTGSDDRMGHVLEESKGCALRLYEREIYDSENGTGSYGWRKMLKHVATLSSSEFAVFKAVHEWRDKVAREMDESHQMVMPKHQLFSLARRMPIDIPGVLHGRVSQAVRLRVSDLVKVIQKAKDSAELEPERDQRPDFAADKPSLLPNTAPKETEEEEEEEEVTPVAVPVERGMKIDIFAKKSQPVELRAEESSFWGQAFGSSRWEARSHGIDGDVRLAIPLPQLTAAVFVSQGEERSTPVDRKPVDPGARVEHEYVKHRPEKTTEDNDVIVVKSVGGRKRKIDETTTPESTIEMESAADGDSPQQHTSHRAPNEGTLRSADDSPGSEVPGGGGDGEKKKQKHRKHKKRKQQQQQQQQQDGTAATVGDGDKPLVAFDYSKAAPVLGGNKSSTKDETASRDDPSRRKKKKAAAFDPYSKSGDAPKGMHRGQRERVGKSHTFKE